MSTPTRVTSSERPSINQTSSTHSQSTPSQAATLLLPAQLLSDSPGGSRYQLSTLMKPCSTQTHRSTAQHAVTGCSPTISQATHTPPTSSHIHCWQAQMQTTSHPACRTCQRCLLLYLLLHRTSRCAVVADTIPINSSSRMPCPLPCPPPCRHRCPSG